MTPFRWTDRHGVPHDLDSVDAIEGEYRQIRTELLNLGDRLRSLDNEQFLVVYDKASLLRDRRVVLQDNLREYVRHEAAKAAVIIGQIVTEASHLKSLHLCYEQHAAGDSHRLDGPPSAEQAEVLERRSRESGLPFQHAASFRVAHALMLANPVTCRMPLPRGAAGFEWSDRNLQFHQVRDLRQIEREYVQIAGELDRIVPELAATVPIRDTFAAMERAKSSVNRISVLERNMNFWNAHAFSAARDEFGVFLDELEKPDGHGT